MTNIRPNCDVLVSDPILLPACSPGVSHDRVHQLRLAQGGPSEFFAGERDASRTAMSEVATPLLEAEDMVVCPACGLPVVRAVMRRIPNDDRMPWSTVRLRVLVAPAQPGDDWVCADCLGAVGQA